MDKITLGRYYPGESPIHRMDPRRPDSIIELFDILKDFQLGFFSCTECRSVHAFGLDR